MELIKSIAELEALDKALAEICTDLSYSPGSLFRIAWQYLKNWGVEVTEENSAWIENRTNQSYYGEWLRSTVESMKAIKEATKNAGIDKGNPDLNTAVGKLAVEILLSMDDGNRNFRICDVGAGEGETTKAVLDFMNLNEEGRKLVEKCYFTLLDPSRENLYKADSMVESHRINQNHDVRYRTVRDNHTFLEELKTGNFDLIVSNAVFHHMTFPTYLYQIEEGLAEDGVVVIGDWYTTIWKHPAFVAEILKRLGISDDKLHLFEYEFDIGKGDAYTLEKELEPHQVEANRQIVDYEAAIGREFKDVAPAQRLFFLEAHEALGDRLEKMKEADLVTDIDELKEKHTGFVKMDTTVRRMYPNSDIAAVIAAAKIPGKKPKASKAKKSKKLSTLKFL